MLIILLVLGLIVEIGARLGAETLWFEEVGYLPMYLLRLGTQGILGVVVFIIATVYLLGNLALAQCLKFPNPPPDRQQVSFHTCRSLTLRWLLPLTLSLSLLVGVILVHYVQMAIAILFYPRLLLRAIAPILSISIAWVLSRQWMRILPYFQATAFHSNDPVFGQDISLYVFGLPVGELLEFWLMGGCLYGFIAVLLTYLLSGDSLSQGRFLGGYFFSPSFGQLEIDTSGDWLGSGTSDRY